MKRTISYSFPGSSLLIILLVIPASDTHAITASYIHIDNGTTESISGTITGNRPGKSAITVQGDGSVVNIQPGTQISTHDDNANAILAQHKGTLNFDGATITTHGDQSQGVNVALEARVSLNGGQVTTHGTASPGLYSTGSGTIANIDGTQVTTLGKHSTAIQSRNQVQMRVDNAELTGHGTSSFGISLLNSTLTSDNTRIQVHGTASAGLFASESNATVQNASIHISAHDSIAVQLQSDSQVVMDNLTATGNGRTLRVQDSDLLVNSANVSLDHGHLLYVIGSPGSRASAVLNDVHASSADGNLALIDSNTNADVTIVGGSYHTQGERQRGMQVMSPGSTLDVSATRILTEGDNANALENRGLTNIRNSQIDTTGRNAHGLLAISSQPGLFAHNMQVTTHGSDSYGAIVLAGGDIDLSHSTVTTHGGLAHALGAQGSQSTLKIAHSHISTHADQANGLNLVRGASFRMLGGSLQTRGDQAAVIQASHNDPLKASNAIIDSARLEAARSEVILASGSDLEVTLNNSLALSGSGMLVRAAENNSGAGSHVRLQLNNTRAHGDIQADANSTVAVELRAGSALDAAVQSRERMLIDTSSHWQLRASSKVSGLDHSGTLAFATTPGFKTLRVAGDLNGNGHFHLNSSIANQQADRLIIEGQTHGQHRLHVRDSGHEPTQTDAQITLVEGNGGTGGFSLQGGHVDVGALRYTLQQAGPNWVLANDPRALEPTRLSKGANAAVASQTARAALWSSESAPLRQRFADLRSSNHDQGGLWLRAVDRRLAHDTGSSRPFEQTIRGTQIGADRAVGLASGQLLLGGLVGLSDSRQGFGEGSNGTINNKTLGLYASFLHTDGLYVDALARYSRYDNDLHSPDNLGDKITAAFASNAYGLAIDVGKRFELSKLFVEPSLQLASARQERARYTASNGLQVQADALDSLQSRIGLMLGTTLTTRTGLTLQPYLKGGWVNEHAGHSEVKVNGLNLKAERLGERGEVAVGAALGVSERQWVTLDAEYAKGKGIEQPWAISLGYRHLW